MYWWLPKQGLISIFSIILNKRIYVLLLFRRTWHQEPFYSLIYFYTEVFLQYVLLIPNKIGSRVSLLAFIHFYPPFPPPSSIWSSLYRYIDIDLQKQAPISIYRHTFLYRYIFPLMLFIWSAVLWRSALIGNLLPDVEDWVLRGCYAVPVGSTPPKEAPTWTKSLACLMTCYRCSLNATVVLLWILQDASMPEIIDVTAEKNQLRISVLWHLAMGRGGILFRRRHHHRFLAWNPFHATLCQGTKSARQPGNDASGYSDSSFHSLSIFHSLRDLSDFTFI